MTADITKRTRQHTQLPQADVTQHGDLPREAVASKPVDATAGVVLSLSSTPGTDDETVYCGMCLDQQMDIVRSCRYDHQWCKPCLAGYVESQIACNQLSVRCPWLDEAGSTATSRCTEFIGEATIAAIVDARTAAKYRRFSALSDPLVRECPLKKGDGTPCLHLQKGTTRRPEIVCEQCNGTYCFVHANAHQGEACRSYTKRQQAVAKANDWYLKQVSKQCPSCKAPTQKGDGCIHMTCTQCSADRKSVV